MLVEEREHILGEVGPRHVAPLALGTGRALRGTSRSRPRHSARTRRRCAASQPRPTSAASTSSAARRVRPAATSASPIITRMPRRRTDAVRRRASFLTQGVVRAGRQRPHSLAVGREQRGVARRYASMPPRSRRWWSRRATASFPVVRASSPATPIRALRLVQVLARASSLSQEDTCGVRPAGSPLSPLSCLPSHAVQTSMRSRPMFEGTGRSTSTATSTRRRASSC